MAVDKNLFLYNLAAVAIMKNEGAYVKEWLDYHILAGVDHFFIYDNESPDNQREVLQPYIDAGIVTYIFYPGKQKQMAAYNDAVKKFKFFCRYMIFLDGDEFIFPKGNGSIAEFTDEFFADKPSAGGLIISIYIFGSNNLVQADYSRGVLERFTRREGKLSTSCKPICNPRKIKFMSTPHYPNYVDGAAQFGAPADKIVINHYYTKSLEEYRAKYQAKNKDGDAFYKGFQMDDKNFHESDHNDVFDDGILKYCEARRAALIPEGGNIFAAAKQIDYLRLSSALIQNLFPVTLKNTPPNFLNGKLETFLTCIALSAYLKTTLFGESAGKFWEETSLEALYKTLFTNVSFSDIYMLIAELPNLLPLDYPVVKNIFDGTINLTTQLKNSVISNASELGKWMLWQQANELDYMLDILKMVDTNAKK